MKYNRVNVQAEIIEMYADIVSGMNRYGNVQAEIIENEP